MALGNDTIILTLTLTPIQYCKVKYIYIYIHIHIYTHTHKYFLKKGKDRGLSPKMEEKAVFWEREVERKDL